MGIIDFFAELYTSCGICHCLFTSCALAIVQLGWISAALSLLGFISVNMLMGNLVEPRWMGRGLNLSPLVVFVSLVLWGWVLGPVGMLLSIPLTIMLKIGLESQTETKWIGSMLGSVASDSN